MFHSANLILNGGGMERLRVSGPRDSASEEAKEEFQRSVELSQNVSCVQHMDEFMYCMVRGRMSGGGGT